MAKQATKVMIGKWADEAQAKVTSKLSDDDLTAVKSQRLVVVAGVDEQRARAIANVEGKVRKSAEGESRTFAAVNEAAYKARAHDVAVAKVGRVSKPVDRADMRSYIDAALKANDKAKRTPTSITYSREHLGQSADLAPSQWAHWCEVWGEATGDDNARMLGRALQAGANYSVGDVGVWAKANEPAMLKSVEAAKAKRVADAKAAKAKADKAKRDAKRTADAKAKREATAAAKANAPAPAKAKRASTSRTAKAKAAAKRTAAATAAKAGADTAAVAS